MFRIAIILVVLYALLLAVITVPVIYVCLAYKNDSSGMDYLEMYASWQYWLVIGIFLLAESALLFVPLRIARSRPVSRRALWIPVVTSGFLLACLLLAMVLGISEIVERDPFSPKGWSFTCVAVAAVGIWIFWAVIFHRRAADLSPGEAVGRCRSWLSRGSMLALLVAVPMHVVARHREYCCAGCGTFLGIAVGLPVMLLSFGPGVFFLYAERWKRLHPVNSGEKGRHDIP
ncbi:MAG: hypothetical protein V1809_07975 [Planctomycetota bacterium]